LVIGVEGDEFVLRVSDDGKGIPTHRLQTNTSHGLASMRHRIAALGGTWEVRSPSTGGTIVIARIPLTRMLPIEPANVETPAAAGEGSFNINRI
jgi:signal transduction histidine kinase